MLLLLGLLAALYLHPSAFTLVRTGTSESMRWQQLEGQSASAVGSDALFEILDAPDAVLIFLMPRVPTGRVQGLAWWSPSRGLWFALDGAPSAVAGTKGVLWLRLPGQELISPGVVDIHSDGSGRIVSRAGLSTSIPREGVITLELRMEGVTLTGRIDASRLRSSSR